MKRVLYVDPMGDIGGAEVSLLSLLPRLGYYIPEVVVPSEGKLSARLRLMGIPVSILEAPEGIRTSPVGWAWSVFRLATLCRQRNISLMHANHEFANRRAVLASWLARVPYVCHVRNIQTPQSFQNCWLGLPQVLVANSRATERSYAGALRPGQGSHVVYNGIDLSVFDAVRDRSSRWRTSAGQFLMAQVGRITEEKGIHIFVQALAKVRRQCNQVLGLVVGDCSVLGSKSYEAELRRLASSLGLSSKLMFTGYIEDMPLLYRTIDLLVQPSACEPFGRSVLEAMAMGLPVVATSAGGVTEVVVDGESGLLVAPGDADALAEMILRIVKDPSLAQRLGENGRARAQELFSIEKHVARIEEVYGGLLKDKKGRRAA